MSERQVAWMLSEDPFPAVQSYASHLRLLVVAQALGESGLAPTVVSRDRQGAGLSAEAAPGLGQLAHPVLRGWLGRPGLEMLAAWPWLYHRAVADRPRWLYLTNPLYAPVAWVLKRRLGQQVIVHADFMGLISLECLCGRLETPSLRLVARAWRSLEAIMLRSADLVTTVNDAHADIIAARGYQRPIVVRDGGDPLPTSPAPANQPPRLVFVGSLQKRRLDDLFAALELLAREKVALDVVIVGDGPDRARYEERAQALAGVQLAGYRPQAEALSLAAQADIAYSDCWSQAGFPFKLFEYMASGKAIVVEDKPQMAEVLSDGKNALFYHGPVELATRLAELAADPEQGRRLGRAARLLFEREHTWDHRRAQWKAIAQGRLEAV